MRFWFPPVPLLLAPIKGKSVSPFTSQVCWMFEYLEDNSLCVYWHLRLITSFYPFVSTGLVGIRDTDSRTVCQARQSLSYSMETDCHLGLDSVVRFAEGWHEHPLKRLWNVCLLSVPADPFPTLSPDTRFLADLSPVPGASFLALVLCWQNQLPLLNVQKAPLGKHVSPGGGAGSQAHHFLLIFLRVHFTWLEAQGYLEGMICRLTTTFAEILNDFLSVLRYILYS